MCIKHNLNCKSMYALVRANRVKTTRFIYYMQYQQIFLSHFVTYGNGLNSKTLSTCYELLFLLPKEQFSDQ